MRIIRDQIFSQIKQNLRIEFTKQDITAHGGLELIRRYFCLIGLHRRVRAAFARHKIGGDYRPIDMVLVIIALLLVGGSRLDHIAYMSVDPLVKRFCGLFRLPSERSVSRWLKRFTMKSLQALVEVNSEIVCEAIAREEMSRLTIDVDGSVLTTGLKVSWAFRGFNPHHRKHHSYYPITAHLAETGHILRVRNRPGNVHDSKGSVEFMRELIDDLRVRLSGNLPLEFRMDGAFFQGAVMDLLDNRGASYAIKVPFQKWLGLIPVIRQRQRWHRLDSGMGCFEIELPVKAWNRTLRVVIYRKRVYHQTRRNYQLDLFDPNDGYFEYSAITTNKEISPVLLWEFMSGRGAHEKSYAEIKGEWAFDTIPTNHYAANSAWQQISVLGHNLIRSFQLQTIAEQKKRSKKRTFAWIFQSMKTLRFVLLNQPARIVRPQGYNVLKFSVATPAKQLISHIEKGLALAA